MTVITTEKLSPTVGALVEGVDRDHLLDDEAFPAWCLDALEAERRPGVPRSPPRRRHAGGLEPPAGQGRGARPGRVPRDLPRHPRPGEESLGRVPQGHLPLAHRRLHRRHPDHGDDAQRLRRGRDRRRDRVRQLVRRVRRARATTRRPTSSRFGSSTRSRRPSALVNPDPTPEEVAMWRTRPAKEHPLVWTPPIRAQVARPRRHGRSRRRHGARREPGAARRPPRPRHDTRARRTATHGRSATSSSGTTGACCTGRCTTTPPRLATCTAPPSRATNRSSERRHQ